jgi:hypothetical protein
MKRKKEKIKNIPNQIDKEFYKFDGFYKKT